jgi:hypothetical protein
MRLSRAFGVACLVLVATVASRGAAAAASTPAGVPAFIHHYEPVHVASPAAGTAGSAGGPLTMSFTTLGEQFDLELEPSDLFTADARVQLVGANGVARQVPVARGSFFRGVVSGDDGSWVRLGIDGDELSGIVATAADVYFIEPARHFFGAKAAGRSVAYRLSETDPAPLGACAAHAPARPAFARTIIGGSKLWPHAMTRELAARADVGTAALVADKRAELGIVGDFEYFSEHGAASAQDLAATVNAVDGIYQSELGVAMQIRSLVVFTASNDPFTDTTDYNTLLNEFSAYHDNNDNTPSQPMYNCDLAHLVSGRNFNGDVIGLAWLGTLCGGYWGSGISQDFTSSQYVLTLLMAHEIGHNFGAPHDAQTGSVCQSAPATFIMNPFLGSNLLQQFSACSKTEIAKEVDAASCFDAFTPGPSATPTPTYTRTRTPSLTPSRTGTFTRTPTSPPIGIPAISQPAAGQTINVSTVSFAWSTVANATGYELQVLGTPSGATIFSGSLTGNGSTSALITVPTNGNFQFKVRACINAACGTFATRSFSVSLTAPSAAPSVTFPTAGAVLAESVQSIAWTAVSGAPGLQVYYEVELINLANNLSELRISLPDPTLNTVARLHDGDFRVRVRACQAGCGPYSAPIDFSADLPAQPTSAPTITSTSRVGSNLTINWNAVNGAEWYQIYVIQPPPAGPGGGALTVAAREVVGTSVVLPIPNGAADVIAAACTGNGCGPFSGSKPVSSSAPNPNVPNLGTPLGGSVVNGPGVLFTWNRIPGDNGSNTTYRLFVQDLSRAAVAFDVYTTANFYGGYFKAEGARYDALVVANPGPSQVVGPAVGFLVAGQSPTAPTMVQPAHNSTVDAGNVQLGWSPLPGATLYEYFVSANGLAPVRGVTPGLIVQVPLAAVGGSPTAYSAIVRACPAGATCAFGSDTNWGPWSNVAGPGVTNFTVTP